MPDFQTSAQPASQNTPSSAQTRWTGAGLCTLSAAGFASMTILGKIALSANISLSTILCLRFGGAALLLFAYLAFIHHKKTLPGRRLALSLLLLGAIGYTGPSALYFGALGRNPAYLNSLLLYVYPAFVALFGWMIDHKPPTLLEWGAMGLASGGVVLTLGINGTEVLEGEPIDGLGIILVIGSAAWYALYILISDRYVHRAGPWVSTAWISAGASVSFLAGGWITKTLDSNLPPAGPWILLAMVLLSTILPLGTFLAGVQRVGPTTASLLSTLEPVFTVLLAVLLLGETLLPIQIAGGALVLAAVILLSLPQRHE
jgi:drug/metabolite transporter (DMT)-like permease